MNDITTGEHPLLERYQRAQQWMEGFGTNKLVQNDSIFPVWIEGSECFWYERAYKIDSKEIQTSEKTNSDQQPTPPIAKQYRLVDAQTATNQPAFDHAALAAALSKAADQPVDPEALPITRVNIRLTPRQISFTAFEQHWQFDVAEGQISYVGHLEIAQAGYWHRYTYSELVNRSSEALEFLAESYPTLFDKHVVVWGGPGQDSFFEFLARTQPLIQPANDKE